MARCSYTFVVSLVLTSSIAFLAAHIVRTMFLQVSKGNEIEACNEEDLDCAGQLQNIQVRVGPFSNLSTIFHVFNHRRPLLMPTHLNVLLLMLIAVRTKEPSM